MWIFHHTSALQFLIEVHDNKHCSFSGLTNIQETRVDSILIQISQKEQCNCCTDVQPAEISTQSQTLDFPVWLFMSPGIFAFADDHSYLSAAIL